MREAAYAVPPLTSYGLPRPRFTRKFGLNFHRFRSRGREPQLDGSGALLEIEFSKERHGPLALGYACHFGLGMFAGNDPRILHTPRL